MSASADPNFEELFVRIVPVEVCCIHASSTNGSASSTRTSPHKGSPNSHCLRMQQGPSTGRHLQESLMPGTPSSSCGPTGSGLYPNLSSAELGPCLCPNCCSNGFMTSAEHSANSCFNPNDPALNSSAEAAAGGGLPTVAVQRLTVRVLGQKTRYGANGRLLPGCFKLEMTSDSSLFFLFQTTITEAAFSEIKESCDLSLAFQQLPGLLLQLLDLLVRQPSTYLSRLMMQPDSSAALEFAQTLGFKTISLLVLPRLEPAPAAVVRGYVTARHNAVLERCAGTESELAELKALVRQRCPNLLLQTNKAGHHHSGRPESALA